LSQPGGFARFVVPSRSFIRPGSFNRHRHRHRRAIKSGTCVPLDDGLQWSPKYLPQGLITKLWSGWVGVLSPVQCLSVWSSHGNWSPLSVYRLHNVVITRLYQSLMAVMSFCKKQSGVMMSLGC